MFKITATPVNARSTQKVWRHTSVKSALPALELVKGSKVFDCVKIEHPTGWQQFERDGSGNWQETHSVGS